MKSIDKLRTTARNMAKGSNLENHDECNLLLIIADEIEAEIAERYMELPVDADGVPIHVGDEMFGDCPSGKHVSGRVAFIGENRFMLGNVQFCLHGDYMHHVKPRTLEDVLNEFGIAATRELNADPDGYGISDKTIAKCVLEIRELLDGDAK